MFSLLKQPYPTEEPVSRSVVKSIAVGVFIMLFLLAFQPFGIDDWQTTNKALKITGYGVVATLVMATNYIALPLLFPHAFSDKHWTVGKEIIRIVSFITVIAVGNRLYLGWIIDSPLVIGSWLWMIGITFLIGLFPTVGLVLLSYIAQLKKYTRSADELSKLTPTLPVVSATSSVAVPASELLSNGLTTLLADNEKDKLVLPMDDLLFIESSDNYCTVVYLKNDQPTKPLLRSSLSRLEKQIAEPHIVRCHRSYVVNLHRIERVTGNAQGYKLQLQNGQFQIPVARQYNETLIAELKGL